MSEEKQFYTREELKEFEDLLLMNLDKAKKELETYRTSISRKNETGTDSTTGSNFSLESGAETAEKEHMNQLASRQSSYIKNLENALIRIKNGSYRVCSVTVKLISKERLRAVPHTTQSIEAKNAQA